MWARPSEREKFKMLCCEHLVHVERCFELEKIEPLSFFLWDNTLRGNEAVWKEFVLRYQALE
jgi:hypothetical protein